MKRTRHFSQRMSHRGVNGNVVDLVVKFGEIQGDRYVLNRRTALQLLEEARELERTIKKVLDKGGVVVVAEDGNLITTYNYTGERN